MSILTFPAAVPNHIELTLQSNTQNYTSPLTRVTQTQDLGGDQWLATLSFPPLFDANARTLRAFLAQLRGPSGRFYLKPYGATTPAGVATGTPLVKGANQTGTSLAIDGAAANVSGWLLVGDYFTVNNELKMVVADCNTNGSGETTVVFEPPLRTAPADNAPLTVTNPTVVMKLIDDKQARWILDPGAIYGFSLACEEALEI